MAVARSSEVSRVLPLLLLAVTVLVLFFARDLLILFAFALMLAFLLAPAVSRLEAARIPRVVAVAITGVLTFSIICGVGYLPSRHPEPNGLAPFARGAVPRNGVHRRRRH
jgi:predicted PurR-regulated permease PerM